MAKKHITGAKAARRARFLNFIFLMTLILAIVLCYTLCLNPRKNYDAAMAELEAEHYSQAAECFEKLGSYKDSEEKRFFAESIVLFTAGKLDEGYAEYEKLSSEYQEKVNGVIGSFEALGDLSSATGNYASAFSYYSFDKSNPVSAEKAYALEVYLTANNLFESGSYTEARETAKLVDTKYLPYFSAESFINNCYSAEYELYEAIADTDTEAAAKKMETISAYPRAAAFLSDLAQAYSAAFDEMNKGNFANAMGLFESLNTYKDSKSMIFNCRVLEINQRAEKGETEAAVAEIKLLGEEALDLLPENSVLWDAMGGDWSVGSVVYYGMYNGKHIKWVVVENAKGTYTIVTASPLMNISFDDTNPAAKWNGSSLAELVKGELTQNFMKGGSRELTGALRVPYVNNVPAIDKVAEHLSYETYWLTDGGQPAIWRQSGITKSISVTDEYGLMLYAEVKDAA